jgi:hypothetical protein
MGRAEALPQKARARAAKARAGAMDDRPGMHRRRRLAREVAPTGWQTEDRRIAGVRDMEKVIGFLPE